MILLSTPFHKYDDVCWERDGGQLEARRRVDVGTSARRNNKEMGPSRPNPAGGWGLRSISLSFVVDDASASPPPLFATSPRKTHPQTSSYLWKGVLSIPGSPTPRMYGLLIGLLLLVGCQSGVESVLKLKLGHVGAPDSLFSHSAREFARLANERLQGSARVVVFGASQLGSDEVLLQKLKLGTVDLALPSTIMSSYVDEFGVFEMPYLVKDQEHMKRIEAEIFWPQLAPAAERKGYRVLAVWENGFRHITNNIRPIRVPEDLRGIKLRTPRGRWRVRMFQAFGANPSPMAFSEVFVALQTGVMDGQENPFSQIYTSKFHEVQTHLSITRHVYTPAYLTVGKERWNELPSSIREVLEGTAREVRDFVHRTAARIDSELLQELTAAGLEVNEATMRSSWPPAGKCTRTSPKRFRGAELIEKALSLAEAESR